MMTTKVFKELFFMSVSFLGFFSLKAQEDVLHAKDNVIDKDTGCYEQFLKELKKLILRKQLF